MAATTQIQLQYRTFDELMNEVYSDFSSFTREGMVEPANLIKIAQKCNKELGLRIHSTKETILEVEHGVAKLPSDFHFLNLALLCHHYEHVEPGLFNGLHTENRVVPVPGPTLSTCPCWTVVAYSTTQAKVDYCDGTSDTIVFEEGTTKLCAMLVTIYGDTATATKGDFCYNNPDTGTFICELPDTCACDMQDINQCNVVNADPWKQNRVFTQCNGTMQVNVIEYHSNQIRRYREFERLRIVPSKEASAFCVNTQFRDAVHEGSILDGFLRVHTLNKGKVYICYEGAMEDEQGNLLVLDHPIINEYYEWALKERILSNLYLNGEPDLERRHQLAKEEYRLARIQAMGIVRMPSFFELKKAIENNRKAMYQKYLHPFSSLYGNTPGWPWAFNTTVI